MNTLQYNASSEAALNQAIAEMRGNMGLQAKPCNSEFNSVSGWSRERSFIASLLSIDKDEVVQGTATFYIMNTSRNRNRWAVSAKALEEALPTLQGKPLGLGAGYRTEQHYPEEKRIDIGHFTETEMPGSYALASAEIKDKNTWDLMKNGKLGSTSVVIYSFEDVCSSCRSSLSGIKDPYGTHSCLVADNSAHIIVESFQFKRVDFVDVPAYPQAGLINMRGAGHGTEEYKRSLELFAGIYESQPTTYNAKSQADLDKAIAEMKSNLGLNSWRNRYD